MPQPQPLQSKPQTPVAPEDARLQALCAWLAAAPGGLQVDVASLQPASSDASFRRYFRVQFAARACGSCIVMDAPPPQENIRAFLQVDTLLRAGGISAPQVLASDAQQGFILLSDLGRTTYLQALQDARGAGDLPRCLVLMLDAMDTLVRLQSLPAPELPVYDAARLRTELELFPRWYVGQHLGATLSADEQAGLHDVFNALLANNMAQPQVLVHRDYHSRNLMLLDARQEHGNPGVLDFQDAVVGPITYDLASLLRDAYIAWPEEQQLDWAIRYWERARKAALPVDADFSVFYRDFEWMGLQRHLKVLGIFARLWHRDGKAQYLDDLPMVLAYTRATAARYHDFNPLMRLLERLQGVRPRSAYTF
ncbi:MAG: phosphotransferase [Betaproteobacteria bacterium]|nr:phosphotransferase [Betaproteobacteria bacterium]